MDDPVRIFYVCERCGSALPPFPAGGDSDFDAIIAHIKSDCEDDSFEPLFKNLHGAFISETTGARGVEDQDGRAVLTPLGAGPSLRPWRREPVSRVFCPHCSGGNGAAASSSKKKTLRGTTHQAQRPPSSSTQAAAQTSSSSETTAANGIDYKAEAIHPRPQLADRLCVVTTSLREGPLGESPANTPLLTLTTPSIQQEETSTATTVPAAAARPALLAAPSVHNEEDEEGHSFGRDEEQEKTMGKKS
ncbi:hypothetical protein PG985_007137 [Apiospora marii]|uniref:Uncharacterized protein n=1 Tax=Apiospora marii TaxID=335849 RepID=A0ABR1SEX8_9PEZI